MPPRWASEQEPPQRIVEEQHVRDGEVHALRPGGRHPRAARRNDLTIEEITEVILQSAIYSVVPAANAAFQVATEVFAADGD